MTNTAFFMIVTLAEFLLIALGFAITYFLRLRKIKKSNGDLEVTDFPGSHGKSSEKYNHIGTTLRNIIQVTRQRINQSINNKQENEFTRLLTLRIEYLQTELNALLKNDEDESYWHQLETELGSLFQESVKQEPSKINQIDLEELHNKINFQANRIKTLDKFKKLYLDLRKQLKQYQESVEALAAALGRGEVEHKDFSQLVLELRKQDEELHQKLKQADDVIQKLKQELSSAELAILKFEGRKEGKQPFAELTTNVPKPTDQNTEQLKELVNSKFSNIEDLRQLISQSTGQSGLSEDLDEKLTALENARDELMMCIEVLELENKRLQEQVSAFENRNDTQSENNIDGASADHDTSASANQNTVQRTDHNSQALHNTIVEKDVMIGSLNQTNKEQLQCIAILEDQIKMLESEIENLKVSNAEDNKAKRKTSSGGEGDMSEQVESLKSQLQTKTDELAKLRIDYTTLEQEFLSLSEDL